MTAHDPGTYAATVPRTAFGYVRSSPGEPPRVLRDQALEIRRVVQQQFGPAGTRRLTIVRDPDCEQPQLLARILQQLADGAAQKLYVTRWDRLSTNSLLLSGIRQHARRHGWTLRILDSDNDDGRGSLRSVLTTEGLARARQRGQRLGRPRTCPDWVLDCVVELHLHGHSMAAIAEALNKERVPTPGGGPRWHSSYVSRLLRTQDGQARRETRELDFIITQAGLGHR